MSDQCGNCGNEITEGGLIKGPNWRLSESQVKFVNFLDEVSCDEMCDKCGSELWNGAVARVQAKIAELQEYLKKRSTNFPMMTLGQMPEGSKYKVKTMLTANVTVGTGFFSEFSQEVSDMFGMTNTGTGMAYKTNSGEATARSILASKAMSIGANCIIGVDIDYGTTANNSATINMQGTAVKVSNLADILDEEDFRKAQHVQAAYDGIVLRYGWLNGDLKDSLN